MILTPVSAILDTGAGPNLIRETVLPEDWERYRIPGHPAFHIVGAGGRRLLQKGNIALTVQLGTLKVQARFIVVESLAAECTLGCQFIDRQVQAILPKEKRVTLANGSVIPILQDSDPNLVAGHHTTPKELPVDQSPGCQDYCTSSSLGVCRHRAVCWPWATISASPVAG